MTSHSRGVYKRYTSVCIILEPMDSQQSNGTLGEASLNNERALIASLKDNT